MDIPQPRIDKPINVVYSAQQEAPICADDVKNVLSCPITQLFVVSRSGSVLIHSLLDSHPEILDIPHIFKFYDFVLDCNGFEGMEIEDIAEKFITYSQHLRFFDSSLSVHIGGRLGPEMRRRIIVDRDMFKLGFMTSMLEMMKGGENIAIRHIFIAAIMGYNWCIGKDFSKVKVIFQHLHHGDWLRPDLLIDFYNLQRPRSFNPENILQADRYIVTVRAPFATYASVCNYGKQVPCTREEEIVNSERFMRLLMQDWVRAVAVKNLKTPVEFVRFEDLKDNHSKIITRLCDFMGISPDFCGLSESTFYGAPWHGDIYSAPATVPGQGAGQSREEFWQDNVIIDYGVGSLFDSFGYERTPPEELNDALNRSLTDPSPRLINSQSGPEGIKKACGLSALRFDFARRIKQQHCVL